MHDELLLECPKGDARGVALWLKAKMAEVMEEILGAGLGGPKCAEVGYGPSRVSAWSWRWCFNNIKNKYPELRVRASLTEDSTRRIELARA